MNALLLVSLRACPVCVVDRCDALTGGTWSSGWASGGFDTSCNGAYDAFVAKLTASGGHAWSTYLGGSGR